MCSDRHHRPYCRKGTKIFLQTLKLSLMDIASPLLITHGIFSKSVKIFPIHLMCDKLWTKPNRFTPWCSCSRNSFILARHTWRFFKVHRICPVLFDLQETMTQTDPVNPECPSLMTSLTLAYHTCLFNLLDVQQKPENKTWTKQVHRIQHFSSLETASPSLATHGAFPKSASFVSATV